MSRSRFQSAVIPPAELAEPALWFIFRGSRMLVRIEERQAALPRLLDAADMGLQPVRRQYLGRLGERHCFSAEVAREAEAPEGWSFHGLRRLFGLLPEELIWVAGAAKQIVDWERTHLFCGRCGAETERLAHERARKCPQCGLTGYPRIAPAIIVALVRGDRILLASSRRHTGGMYSVLAGFVEPGETLEAAVVREIREEVGLEVRNIRYFGSQPWPFPNSLMLAFTCQYAGGQIVLEEEELADAGWYSADNLPTIPPRISIARRLIDWFVEQNS